MFSCYSIEFSARRDFFLVNLVQEEHQKLQKQNLELQDAIIKVKQLSGMLPICSKCKKIRDDKGYWNQLESYIEKHSDTSFSHGICPECSDGLYGDEDWYIEMKKEKKKRIMAPYFVFLALNYIDQIQHYKHSCTVIFIIY